jgi:hypothetical protein
MPSSGEFALEARITSGEVGRRFTSTDADRPTDDPYDTRDLRVIDSRAADRSVCGFPGTLY